MELTIRNARLADYEMLLDVMEEGDRYHRKRVPSIFRAPQGPSRSVAYIESILDDPAQALLVAEIEHRITGVLHISIRTAPDTPIHVPRRYANISMLAVQDAFRRQGIGTALMQRAHEWAYAQGTTDIELGVYEFNHSAIALYQKLGYVTSRRTMSLQPNPPCAQNREKLPDVH